MNPLVKKISSLPPSLKIAIFLFVTHIALYVEGMWEAHSRGLELHPLWFFHLLASAFIASTIPRQRKGGHTTIAFYCVLISVITLRNEYVAFGDIPNVFDLMFRSIVLYTPLLMAAIAVVVGRQYYLGSVLPSGDSMRSDA
jgi:hypothetical protein